MSAPTNSPAPARSGRFIVIKVLVAIIAWLLLLGFLLDLPNALRWPARVLWFAITFWLGWRLVQQVRRIEFTWKKTAFIGITGLFVYGCLSLVCVVFNKVVSQRDDGASVRGMTTLPAPCREGIEALLAGNKFPMFNKEVGWVPRPGYAHPNGLYTINKQGVRGSKEYPLPAPYVTKRYLCVGDSFTFGVAVKDDECYTAHAERLRAGTEWINLGNPGGCLVQAYQRYLCEAPKFGGKHVITGFMSNDAQRTVNAFRPLLNIDSGCPFTKPFAKVVKGIFSIEPNPYATVEDYRRLLANPADELARLSKLDYLSWCGRGQEVMTGPISRTLAYGWEVCGMDRNFHAMMDSRIPLATWIKSIIPSDPYGRSIWDENSSGLQAVVGTFERFRDQVVADGREPLMVLMPGPSDVQDLRHGFSCQYASLVAQLTSRKVPFIDFLPVLASKHKRDLRSESLFVGNHYQSQINKELAEFIIHRLEKDGAN